VFHDEQECPRVAIGAFTLRVEVGSGPGDHSGISARKTPLADLRVIPIMTGVRGTKFTGYVALAFGGKTL